MNKTRIILIIASSIDGRIAFPHGGKTDLGSLEDKKLLSESLSEVDATIFGSGTLKAHQSTFLVKQNGSHLSCKQPVSIVTGDIRNFSSTWSYFKQPIKRWLINSKRSKLKSNLNFNREFLFRGSWKKTLDLLNNEGIKSIALLGGTKLINSFMEENLIDEIKITIVPKIIGGKFSWIPSFSGDNLSNLNNHWVLKSVKELNTNEIFIHYTRKK